jgi:Raf kinase inhibitor-like YbhB/YbcL family protein
MRRRLATLLLAAVVLTACRQEPVIVQLEDIQITSTAFADGEQIPREHTCDGGDTPVPLTWSGVPEGTREVAVLVSDRDAPGDGFVHWAVAGIDPAATAIDDEAVEGLNGFSNIGYGGPCPPPGDEPHSYVFNVYALERGSGLDDGFEPEALTAALQNAIGAGQIVGTYAR